MAVPTSSGQPDRFNFKVGDRWERRDGQFVTVQHIEGDEVCVYLKHGAPYIVDKHGRREGMAAETSSDVVKFLSRPEQPKGFQLDLKVGDRCKNRKGETCRVLARNDRAMVVAPIGSATAEYAVNHSGFYSQEGPDERDIVSYSHERGTHSEDAGRPQPRFRFGDVWKARNGWLFTLDMITPNSIRAHGWDSGTRCSLVLQLHGNGQMNANLTPHDFDLMALHEPGPPYFQDAAGTLPVTMMEQPVGRVGNLLQATAEDRPTITSRGDTKLSNPKDAIGDKKVPMWLCSAIAKAHWAAAQFAGLCKYGAWNWRVAGVRTSTYLSAMARHIERYTNGERLDPVDGTHHLGNIMACAAILLEAEYLNKLTDDRPPRADLSEAFKEVEAIMSRLKEQYADKKPHHHTILDEPPL